MFDSVDPLSELRDIHEPAAGAWLVSPTGWLLVLAGAVVGIGLWRWWRARGQLDPQRAALVELASLRRRQVEGEAADSLLGALASLLRRVALATHSRTAVAGLCGEAWVEFLDRHPEPVTKVSTGSRDLAWAPYCRDPNVDVAQVLAASELVIVSLVARGTRGREPAPATGRRRCSESRRLVLLRWRIRAACRANDADGARRALLRWGELAWPAGPGSGLAAIADRGDQELARMLTNLDRALYAADANHQAAKPWNGRALWRRLKSVLKPALEFERPRDRLPPLYE